MDGNCYPARCNKAFQSANKVMHREQLELSLLNSVSVQCVSRQVSGGLQAALQHREREELVGYCGSENCVIFVTLSTDTLQINFKNYVLNSR